MGLTNGRGAGGEGHCFGMRTGISHSFFEIAEILIDHNDIGR